MVLSEKLAKEDKEKDHIRKQLKQDYKRKIDDLSRQLKEENFKLEEKLHQSVEESMVKIREAQNAELKA